MTAKAGATQNATLQALRLPLESYPGLNRFALDLVKGAGRAAGFLNRRPVESMQPSGVSKPEALASALAESNRRWGNEAGSELNAWKDGRTVSLVAGQQVCFAGGPLLILVKLASLLKIREDLARRGVPATVFFWMATEDHDFDEVASITVQTRTGRARLRAAGESSRQMVGPLPVDGGLRNSLIETLGIEPPRWLREGISYGDSFAELLAEVLRDRGVVLVDSMLPELRRGGREFFLSIVERMEQAERRVTDRSSEIRQAGYTPQVVPAEDGHYSFLYRVDEKGERQPIRMDQGEWKVGGRRSSRNEVLAMVEQEPERISTGVLARPLLQDRVLHTDLFLGGPAEVSYYAQLAPLHEMFGIAQPHAGLRGHLLAAPARTLRPVVDYGLGPEDLFRTPEEIIARLDPSLPERMRAAIEASAGELERGLEGILEAVLEADPQLARSAGRRLGRIRYHLDRLSEQGERAAMRKDGERYNALVRLAETLHPDGAPQDRHVAWITFWTQYGSHLVERIVDEVEPDAPVLKVVGL
ncbi:MAG TPA: bacillithiol biosynthesis cysteine-adding enzyme BshC [Thermoanaerobaculia bacterium]|nr:bacillithiol biosynthesis cysteine-adding enzyme BshC [Thermoanaerobaculia bacterium]